jgi:hypothetical protein
MNASGFREVLFLLVFATLAAPAGAVTYTAKLLHPAGFDNSYAYGVAGASQVGDGAVSVSGVSHALLWSGTAASKVDLSPTGLSGIFDTFARAASGTTQVGYGYTGLGGGPTRALMWSGTAASAVDLHPPGYSQSSAYGVSGASQVGDGTTLSGNETALLWSGTAASAVALNNPAVSLGSHGRAVSGTTQVGYGPPAPFGVYTHALMWSGTAASAVDLNPPGFENTYAYGVSGTSQVGEGAGLAPTAGYPHALLWQGTAASVIDLHPAGFASSVAYGVSSAGQAGYGNGTFGGFAHNHALYWNSTAASAVDLHSFLTGLGPTFTDSEARGISDTGDIVGVAYTATGVPYAVLWKPVIGDYSGDGKVDAADYVLWRKNPGAYGGPEGYNAWRANFGQPAGSGAGLDSQNVPEPLSWMLFSCALIAAQLARVVRSRTTL